MKSCSFVFFSISFYKSIMSFGNFLADGKANSGATVLLSMKALKHFKQIFFISWVKTNTVIGHRNSIIIIFTIGHNFFHGFFINQLAADNDNEWSAFFGKF